MTKLERIYGISVLIEPEINSSSIKKLSVKAIAVAKLKNFNLNEFCIFRHHVVIEAIKKRKHFSNRFTLSERIKVLDITFKVNPKQAKKGSIKFVNLLLDDKYCDLGYLTYNSENNLKRFIPGDIIEKNGLIETELITFIRKDSLLERHRKITVSIIPQPTDEYKAELRKTDDFHSTDISQRLDKQVELKIDEHTIEIIDNELNNVIRTLGLTGRPIEEQHFQIIIHQLIINMDSQSNFNNYGQAGNMGNDGNVSRFTQNQNFNQFTADDYDKLALEFKRLKEYLQTVKDENDDSHLDAISSLIKAEKAAHNKEGTSIIEHLKNAGKWALDAATKIGTTLAAEVLKKSMGLS